jgi:hypothetical protein
MAEAKAHTKKPAKKTGVKKDVVININSNCKTEPQGVTLYAGDTLQFKCGANQLFGVRLDGGVFVGRDDDFVLIVNGPTPVPSQALVVDDDVDDDISNYVFDMDGNNCTGKAKDNPPDIIIQS